MKRKTLIPVLIIVLIAAVVAAVIFSQPQREDAVIASVQITPTEQTENGIEAATAFTITSDYSLSEKRLREMLVVEPALEYTLEGSGKEWKLTPAQPLADNMVYTIRVQSPNGTLTQSFAFQTRSDLLVNKVYPYDGADFVNPATGIEFVFNTPDVDISEHFSILPETPGRIESNGYSATFIPDGIFEEGSIYRVTLKAGLTAPSGVQLQEDYTFSFTTESRETYMDRYERLRLAGEFSETFIPGDTVAVELRCDADLDGVEFDISMHRFDGIDPYITELEARDTYLKERYGRREDYIVQTEALEEVVSYTAPLFLRGENRWDPLYAILPDDIAEGHYVVTISGVNNEGKESFVQKMIQVINMSAYVQSVDGDTLIWLNDPVTGQAMDGISVELVDTTGKLESVTGVTQSDGTARLMTGELTDSALRVLSGDSVLYYERFPLSAEASYTRLSEQYYSVLYTDRELYQPTDTVQFWGMVRPRGAESTLPEKVFVELGTGGSEGATYSVEVPVADDGTLSGSLSFSGMEKSYYTLSVTNGKRASEENYQEHLYIQHSFPIGEYTKPPYVITVTPAKEAYTLGETATVNITATYFDGTPVSGGRLRFNSYSWLGDEKEVTLDAEGQASITAPLEAEKVFGVSKDESVGWEPTYVWYSVSSAGDEDVEIHSFGQFPVVTSNIAIRVEADAPDTATIQTAQFNKDAVTQETDYTTGDTAFEKYAGDAVDVPVTVTVYKMEFSKTLVGTYYDYVNKRNVERYKYSREQILVETIQTQTVDGTVKLENLPYEFVEDGYYWFEVSVNGGLGMRTNTVHYFGRYGLSESEEDSYTFLPSSGNYWENNHAFKLDDTITLGLYKNNVKADNKGKVLYSVVQRKMTEVGLFETDTHALTMNEAYMPNATLAGAYFDGRHVYTIGTSYIHYDSSERALNVEVTTDKDAYQPGDTVTVQLKVTDAQGNPTAASAAVGVVDEALFDIAPQEIELLSEFYRSVYHNYVSQRASYKEYALEDAAAMTGGGGGGGDGGGAVRSEFLDTAWFDTLSVGDSGTGELKFQLPDNVTGWRVTAVAVTDKNEAGNATSNTVATLPFFLQPVVTDRYLEGDDVAVSVNGVGTALSVGDEITYTAVLLSDSGTEIDRLQKTGTAGKKTAFNFGKYDEGHYTVKISAECGEHSDAVQQEFTVSKQAMTLPLYKNMPLSDIATIKPERYPVQIAVYDDAMKPFMDGIEKLTSQSGSRAEVIAASWKAMQIYNDLLDEDTRDNLTRDARLSELIADDGGVRLLPFSSGDAAVTAKVLLAAPDLITNSEYTRDFLRGVLQDPSATPDARVMAYAGLAALREPVLLDVQRQLEHNPVLTNAQKLYLASGLASLGDFKGATAIYNRFSDQIVTEGTLKYLETNGSGADRIQETAAALMLTSLLHHPDADGYMRYLSDLGYSDRTAQDTVLYNLEMLAYLNNYQMPKTSEAAAFTYMKDGKKETVHLDSVHCFTIGLGYEAFANANFTVTKGDVFANVRYLGYAAENTDPPSPLISVEKRYIPVVGDTTSVGGRVKVEVRVTFDKDAPEGCYTVTDYIPSGMRYMTPMYDGGSARYDWAWSTVENEGQMVRANIYRRVPQPLFREVVTTDMSFHQAQEALMAAGYEEYRSWELLWEHGWNEETGAPDYIVSNSNDIMEDTHEDAPLLHEEPVEEMEEPIAYEPIAEEPEADVPAYIPPTGGTVVSHSRVKAAYVEAADEEPLEVEVDITDEAPAVDEEKPVDKRILLDGPATDEDVPVPAEEPYLPDAPESIVEEDGRYTYVVTYYISAALPGDYITESTYVTPNTDGIYARTARGKIQISE